MVKEEQVVLKELVRRGVAHGGTIPEVAKATGMTENQVMRAMLGLDIAKRVYQTKRLRSGRPSWVTWVNQEKK